jgi:hypothetical protein
MKFHLASETSMVIHIGATDESSTSSAIQQLVEKRDGKELRLGKRLIGWNLKDTIVVRRQGLSQAQIQKYVRHFAAQRHVIFEDALPPTNIDPYIVLAREVRDYLFAFLDLPQPEIRSTQAQLMEQFRSASCKVVTLRQARSVQQLEVLLLSAQTVLGSYDPLVLPEPARRKARPDVRKTEKAA